MWTRITIAGVVLWIAALPWPSIGLKETLLLFGALVTTPLALGVSHGGGTRGSLPRLSRILALFHVPAGGSLVVAFAYPAGDRAAALSLAWLLFTLLVSFAGLLRLAQARGRPIARLAVDCGWIYLAIGGVWTVATRRGVTFLGFGDPIAFLTAAHFHFAGLVLPILTGLAAREIGTRFAAATCLGVIAAVPALAAGITLTQQHGIAWAEPLAAGAMVLAALCAATLQARLGWRNAGRITGALWLASSASLVAGAALAAVYATGRALGREWLDIPRMVEMHATTMAFGYAMLGLAGWAITSCRRSPEARA